MGKSDKEVEKREKNPNWKRYDNENYTTVTMRVDAKLAENIKNAAHDERKTITQWILELVDKKLNNIQEDPSRNLALGAEFNKLNDKMDTVINLISKL